MLHEYPLHPYGDNFIPVISVEQETDIRHTDTTSFCSDATCSCHEDPVLVQTVSEQVEQGLLTSDEAIRTVKGEML